MADSAATIEKRKIINKALCYYGDDKLSDTDAVDITDIANTYKTTDRQIYAQFDTTEKDAYNFRNPWFFQITIASLSIVSGVMTLPDDFDSFTKPFNRAQNTVFSNVRIAADKSTMTILNPYDLTTLTSYSLSALNYVYIATKTLDVVPDYFKELLAISFAVNFARSQGFDLRSLQNLLILREQVRRTAIIEDDKFSK